MHAHISSRDCDGAYGHTVSLSCQERLSPNGDLEFKDRVISSVVWSMSTGTLEVTPEGVSWYEKTEEGYRATEVQWCEDDCAGDTSWQRDIEAEKAGY